MNQVSKKTDLVMFYLDDVDHLKFLPSDGVFPARVFFKNKGFAALKLQNATYGKTLFINTVTLTSDLPTDVSLSYAVASNTLMPDAGSFVAASGGTTIAINRVLDVGESVVVWFRAEITNNQQFNENLFTVKVDIDYISTFVDIKNAYLFSFAGAPGITAISDVTKSIDATAHGAITGYDSADVRRYPVEITEDNLNGKALADDAGFTLMFYSTQNDTQRTLANIQLADGAGHSHGARIFIDTDNKITIEIDNGTDISPIWKSYYPIDIPTGLHTLTFFYQSSESPWYEHPTIFIDYSEVTMEIIYGTSFTDPETEKLKSNYHIVSGFFGADDAAGTHVLNGYLYALILYGEALDMHRQIRTHMELNRYA